MRELVRHFTAHRSSAAAIGAQTLASARFATTLAARPRLRAPTLVMHGERDRLVPLAASKLLAARIPDAELAVVPGAGHAYALEAPQRVARSAARLARAPAAPIPSERGSTCGV